MCVLRVCFMHKCGSRGYGVGAMLWMDRWSHYDIERVS